ncbi:ABC transporter permease [Hydromonas duriensis]|uniref:Amino acid ABC transporter membrane protein 1 (PAAT family) n=1 Tax=Hydromonas duriensis TaxID=1527608 RepID=A0A4R6Y8I9_9BURK|nr:ABC transporter permease subunit [Hydromonas duriensis]TDR31713.1 amino acid ABC transporter membrane protein 1 (PAAT family) [Hydromonas duriensis]
MDKINIIMQYMPHILGGAWLTLAVALLSFSFAFALGLLGANMRLSQHQLISKVAAVYSTVVRGVPDLVWMFLVYYGIQYFLNDFTERYNYESVEISPFMAGVFTISFIFGAYFTETFRGAMLAIPVGQMEAGYAYGLSSWQVLKRITFPLLMRFALPGVKNNWLVLTKATALLSIVGLNDVTRLSQLAGSKEQMSFLFNLVSAFLFLLLTTVSLVVFRKLERQYARGVREVRYEV